ncbi:MAG: hypothetical protein Q4E34_04180 [Synergistaceae bacterium]|nr:hypothetical protein [Synergistaceae bacterium]
MKSLSGIVLNFFELLEAEGRLFREKTISTGTGIVSVLIGGLFLFVACLLAAFAAFLWIEYYYGSIVALLVIALVFAAIGSLLVFSGKR